MVGFCCFLRHIPSAELVKKNKLWAGERIKDETEIASNKEKLIQFVDGHG